HVDSPASLNSLRKRALCPNERALLSETTRTTRSVPDPCPGTCGHDASRLCWHHPGWPGGFGIPATRNKRFVAATALASKDGSIRRAYFDKKSEERSCSRNHG